MNSYTSLAGVMRPRAHTAEKSGCINFIYSRTRIIIFGDVSSKIDDVANHSFVSSFPMRSRATKIIIIVPGLMELRALRPFIRFIKDEMCLVIFNLHVMTLFLSPMRHSASLTIVRKLVIFPQSTIYKTQLKNTFICMHTNTMAP